MAGLPAVMVIGATHASAEDRSVLQVIAATQKIFNATKLNTARARMIVCMHRSPSQHRAEPAVGQIGCRAAMVKTLSHKTNDGFWVSRTPRG